MIASDTAPELAGEAEHLRADLAASGRAFRSLQGYVLGQSLALRKLGDDLANAQRETEAARNAEAPWRGMLAEIRSAARRFRYRAEEIAE